MTTPILPTKTVLSTTAFTPAQMNYDKEVEDFLSVTNKYDFLLQLMAAYRASAPSSVTINSNRVILPATSIAYLSDSATISSLVVYLTEAKYGYGYTVTMPADASATSFIPATGSGFTITSGPNAGKHCILVSWA